MGRKTENGIIPTIYDIRYTLRRESVEECMHTPYFSTYFCWHREHLFFVSFLLFFPLHIRINYLTIAMGHAFFNSIKLNGKSKSKKEVKYTRTNWVDYSIVGAHPIQSLNPYSKLSRKATNRTPKLYQENYSKQKWNGRKMICWKGTDIFNRTRSRWWREPKK